MNRFKIRAVTTVIGAACSLTLGLVSCANQPRLLVFPFDPSGRSLNSPFAELEPSMAGRYLALVSDRRGSQDIYLYDQVEQRLIELPGLNSLDMVASHPSVNATGNLIVFVGIRQGLSGIYVYNRDTRQLRNLTPTVRVAVRHPTLSADGRLVAFESSVNGQWDIWVYTIDGQPVNIP